MVDFALLVGCGIVKYNPGRLKGASLAGRVLSPRTVLNSRTSGFGFGQLLKWSQSNVLQLRLSQRTNRRRLAKLCTDEHAL